MASVVPAVRESADLGAEVFGGSEVSAVNRLSFGDPEPDLDQVQPRSRGRGEVHDDPEVHLQLVTDLGRFVGGVVVHHHM